MPQGGDYTDLVIDEWADIRPQDNLETLNVTLRLIRAGRILDAQLDQTSVKHGFAVGGDYEVLAALRRSHPLPLQPAQLAERHLVTTSGMTGRLDRLEKAGFIERHPHPRDRRATEIHITQRGIKTTDKVFAARAQEVTARLAPIPDKIQKDLADLLRIVLSTLEGGGAHEGDGPGSS